LNRPYVDTLSEATRLKLRAANILLGNAEEAAYQAAVVYHEAYRAEARALRALDGPSRETALRSLVEQCGCLVDGLDPSGAHSLWGRILNEEQRLPRRAYNALTSYLRDRSVKFNDRLDAILAKGPAEMRDDPFLFGITIARDEAMRRRATAFFTQVVAAFPGDAQFWMLRALVAAEAGEAWKSIRRSRALMPDMPAYEMVALLIVLGQTGRREYVKSAFEKLSSEAQPEAAVCYGVSFAASIIALDDRDNAFWRIARDASILGERLVPPQKLEAGVFRFFSLLATEKLAGREPTPELASRAGLPIPIGSRDSMKRVLESTRRLVPGYHLAAA
jgi:hypothetical protein